MGQETYTRQHSKKTGAKTVSFDDNFVVSESSLALLFEQQRAIVTPVVETCKTSVISDVCIRGFDIAGSLIMLAITSPAMLLAAILIKITSPGPVLFKQRRVGKDGKIFVLYKFRTMINNAEKNTGPVWATQDDERVTPSWEIAPSNPSRRVSSIV